LQLIAFPQYVPSVLRSMLAGRAPNGCVSTWLQPPMRIGMGRQAGLDRLSLTLPPLAW